MSEEVELPEKKATPNPRRPDMAQDMPSAMSRKRKAGRTADREPSAHEAGRVAIHAEPAPSPARGVQGRRSDLVPVHPTASLAERQRQRHPPTAPAHRRMSMDVHRPRRSNVPNATSRPLRTRRASAPGPPRTMLQHAWHTVLHSDPLVDSDEEFPDEHHRLDYSRRMQVITRLRGRPPTPEPGQTTPT